MAAHMTTQRRIATRMRRILSGRRQGQARLLPLVLVMLALLPALTAATAAGYRAIRPDAARDGLGKSLEPERPRAAVLGFYTDPEPALPGSLETARAVAGNLTYIAPFWYRIGFAADGQVIPYASWFDATQARAVTREMQAKGVKVLALIHNMRLGAPYDMRAIMRTILTDPARRANLVRNIEALVREGGYDGVNLDIEFVYPADRSLFTTFVAELAATLRPAGFLVTADLPAQSSDDPAHGWSGGFDLAGLAPHLDLIAIMTYDEHGWVTTEGPTASIGWVRAAMEYAVTVAPREKLLLGLAGHAFDWQAGVRHPKYISGQLAVANAAARGVEVRWDDRAKSPYYTYTDEAGRSRVVWFESERSYRYKLDLVAAMGLGGVCIWRLGLEDPGLWREIERRFEVVK
jgi:spore germination protein YaaH